MVQQLNIPTACNEIIVKEFEVVKEVIGGIRTIRLQKNIAQKETLLFCADRFSTVCRTLGGLRLDLADLLGLRRNPGGSTP